MSEQDQQRPALGRARNSGHTPLNDMIRADWMKYVDAHPDSFDALLITPEREEVEEEDDGALFGRVDRHQQVITYDAVTLVKAMIAPLEDTAFIGVWDGGEGLGMGESGVLNVLLSCGVAPVGSILEWEEEMAGGELRRVWWYVHSTSVVGSAAVGALHVCIPCGDLEQAKAEAAKVASGEGQTNE